MCCLNGLGGCLRHRATQGSTTAVLLCMTLFRRRGQTVGWEDSLCDATLLSPSLPTKGPTRLYNIHDLKWLQWVSLAHLSSFLLLPLWSFLSNSSSLSPLNEGTAGKFFTTWASFPHWNLACKVVLRFKCATPCIVGAHCMEAVMKSNRTGECRGRRRNKQFYWLPTMQFVGVGAVLHTVLQQTSAI